MYRDVQACLQAVQKQQQEGSLSEVDLNVDMVSSKIHVSPTDELVAANGLTGRPARPRNIGLDGPDRKEFSILNA